MVSEDLIGRTVALKRDVTTCGGDLFKTGVHLLVIDLVPVAGYPAKCRKLRTKDKECRVLTLWRKNVRLVRESNAHRDNDESEAR